jgi:hypothetical protein
VDPEDPVDLEDQEAQAVQAAPADQVILVKYQTQQQLYFQLFPVMRMYRQANCPQVCPVAQAVQAVLEDQEAQVRYSFFTKTKSSY